MVDKEGMPATKVPYVSSPKVGRTEVPQFSGSHSSEHEVNELYQMLEYWKAEAKANEALLAKSNL